MFDAEDDMINEPWHVFFMFLVVICISIAHEVFFHWIDHKVHAMNSASTEKLKAMMSHEVMNLGLIGLWLTFVMELSLANGYWSVALFHYTHFVLFVMMMVFMFMCGFLIWSIRIYWKTWVRYERFTTMVTDDEFMPEAQKELTLSMYWQRNANAKRITNCMKLFERTVPPKYANIPFTRYLRKAQRRHLLEMLNLNKAAWASLSALLLLIAVLVDNYKDQFLDGWKDMRLFIGIVGWGCLFAVLVIWLKIWCGFRSFCSDIDVISISFKSVYREAPPPPDVRKYFWRGKPAFTIQLLQSMLLLQVFYTAIVIIDVVPHVVKDAKAENHWAYAVMAVLPTVLIYGFFLPMMMPCFSCLASLGDLLDLGLLEDIRKATQIQAIQKGKVDLYDILADDGSPRRTLQYPSVAAVSPSAQSLSAVTGSAATYRSAPPAGAHAAAAARGRAASDLGAYLAGLPTERGSDALAEIQAWVTAQYGGTTRSLASPHGGSGSRPGTPRAGKHKDWGGEVPPPALQPTQLQRKEREMLRTATQEYRALQKADAERQARGVPDTARVLSPWWQQITSSAESDAQRNQLREPSTAGDQSLGYRSPSAADLHLGERQQGDLSQPLLDGRPPAANGAAAPPPGGGAPAAANLVETRYVSPPDHRPPPQPLQPPLPPQQQQQQLYQQFPPPPPQQPYPPASTTAPADPACAPPPAVPRWSVPPPQRSVRTPGGGAQPALDPHGMGMRWGTDSDSESSAGAGSPHLSPASAGLAATPYTTHRTFHPSPHPPHPANGAQHFSG